MYEFIWRLLLFFRNYLMDIFMIFWGVSTHSLQFLGNFSRDSCRYSAKHLCRDLSWDFIMVAIELLPKEVLQRFSRDSSIHFSKWIFPLTSHFFSSTSTHTLLFEHKAPYIIISFASPTILARHMSCERMTIFRYMSSNYRQPIQLQILDWSFLILSDHSSINFNFVFWTLFLSRNFLIGQ